MCGVAGFVVFRGNIPEREALGNSLERMTDSIRHRGPDDSGVWIDESLGVAIGHRRLSILDLSERGRQPMVSASGRLVISYNGEVYNFAEIKKELEKVAQLPWRSESDTEVILEAIEHWGIDAAVRRFNGMFALAVWDRGQRVLSLARDRMGKKPLYYGFQGNALLFGSELKALEAHPEFDGSVDRDALAMHLKYNYIPSPGSIYTGVRKLPPASIVQFELEQMRSGDQTPYLAPTNGGSGVWKYWSVGEVLREGAEEPFQGNADEALESLEALLMDSVTLRMLSDVPLGAFLSGGIDSSLIVAAMQRSSSEPVKTFSIGYSSREQDEARFARQVAKHLGTEHTDIYVEPQQVLETVSRLGSICDEPIGDTAMVPTYLLAEETVRHVTVCLSGDGGDETFAGYPRYLDAAHTWRTASQKFGWMPDYLRSMLSGGLSMLSRDQWNRLFSPFSPMFAKSSGDIGKRLGDAQRLLTITHPEKIHQDIGHWKNPAKGLKSGSGYDTVLNDPATWLDIPDVVQRLVHLDMQSRLPDSILAKVDRSTMRASLEARAPLLDYRLIEFSARIPTAMKVVDGDGKWLLRQLLYRYVPRELVDRPKKGFSMPISDWLRGPLRHWAEDLLDGSRLRLEGFFDDRVVRKCWQEHLDGAHGRHYQLWDVLMFQSWLDSRG